MLTDADCERALRTYNTLNDALGVLSLDGVEQLLEHERAHRRRDYVMKRIRMRRRALLRDIEERENYDDPNE